MTRSTVRLKRSALSVTRSRAAASRLARLALAVSSDASDAIMPSGSSARDRTIRILRLVDSRVNRRTAGDGGGSVEREVVCSGAPAS